jgi:hypothetical protein
MGAFLGRCSNNFGRLMLKIRLRDNNLCCFDRLSTNQAVGSSKKRASVLDAAGAPQG